MSILKNITLLNVRSSFYVLVLLFIDVCSSAQEVVFNRVSPPEGSFFGMTNGITQDKEGYMWFSSYGFGLYRYDGYHVTIFRNNSKDSNSLVSNNVACIFTDHNGFIWIGTTASGLDCFDPQTSIFTHFRHKKEEPGSISDDRVIAILEDHTGEIWIGTENGLNRLNQRTKKFVRYHQKPNDTTSLSCNRIQVLYEDHKGALWVGTASPQRFYNSNEQGGLNRLDRKTGKFTRYLHNPKDSFTLVNDRIGAIFEDSRGVFWVSTAGDGLHSMNREKGTFERYHYDPAHPEKLSGPPPQNEMNLDLNNFFIMEDASGAIWIASSKRWVTRYDPKTQKINHYNSFNGDVQAVQSLTKIFSSRDGMLWLTTWAGSIFRVDPFHTILPHVFTGSIVHAIHEDISGALWLGTYGEGFVEANRRQGIVKRFSTTSNRYGFSDSWASAIYEENDSILWIGSGNGLSYYNKKTKIFTRYFNDPKNVNSVTKGYVDAIIENSPGSLWIGTEGGLDYFDIKSRRFLHYRNDPGDSTSLSDNDVMALLKDHSGNLWVGTGDGVLNLLNSRSKKFKHFRCSREIGTIIEDAENVIWVGTVNGLYRGSSSLDTFLNFSRPNIGLTANTIIAGILEDDQKNLWVASSIGILRFNPNRNEISVYSKNQNVDASALTQTRMHGAKGRNGDFFFGDRTGYYVFSPSQVKKNTTPPQIVINNFKLADQFVITGKNSTLKTPLTQVKEISLNYNQNIFSFSFAGINYRNPEDNQHFYMLENLDNDWRKAPIEKTAYYYNVPPGNYIFRVKVANSDGVWAEKAINIIINPPWYRTWWAYTGYVLGFVIVVWLFTWYRSRKLKTANLLLEEKILIRTKELEQSLEEKYQLSKQVEGQQALLNERLRISRELHDDIGSTLGSISIYSEVAKKRTEKNENTNEVLSKIGLASRELIDKMSDIVWSLNPNNESFEQLQNRMMTFAAMMLAPRNIQYDFITEAGLKKMQFAGEQRKNIFLIFKEALHNIVKYAGCKTVHIKLFIENSHLIMIIKDDGKGFDASTIAMNEIFSEHESLGGNGIKNMHVRADDMCAELFINSKINEGTTVQLTLHL